MIENALIVSFAVLAIWQSFRPGHIFSGFADAVKLLAPPLSKPYFDCLVCMVPWYGGPITVLIGKMPPLEFIVVILAAMGINTVVGYLIELQQTFNIYIEYELNKDNGNAE